MTVRMLSSWGAALLAEATRLWETLEPVARRVAKAEAAAAEPRPKLARRVVLGGALAASAAAASYLVVRPPLELWPSLSHLAADYHTGTGERRSVAIDGISIELNTRSSLNVSAATGAIRRLELVAGEAVFATGGVTAPLVLAAGAEVSATAAKFDVRCDGATASVVCLQGTIEIAHRGQVTTLRERQQIAYGADGMGSTAAIDPEIVTAWREGRLVFHGVPLSKVIDEVNRYRRGRIILMNEALAAHPVQAILPIDRADEIMVLLREAYGVKVTTLPGGITILS